MRSIEEISYLLENGQLDKALDGYRDILRAGTDEERFTLAEELFRFGFMEETIEVIEKVLESYPGEGELLVLQAEACIEIGNEEKAMLILEGISEDDDVFPQALLLLADIYQMNGLYEVSEQKLLKAKALLPKETIIDFAIGELYASQGRFAEAIKSYEKVLDKQTQVGGINISQRLAESLSAGGAFEEALTYYEKAYEEQFEINTLFGYAFTALQAGKNQTSIEKFEELRAMDPEYHSLYLHLARAYEQEELLQNAIETVKQGIQQDEFNKDLYFYGGKLSLKLNSEKEAEDMLRQALALDPGFLEAALMLNKLFLKQERYDDVLDIIRAVDANDEEEPQFLWDEALANQHNENYSQALNKYQQAYTFFKENKDFLQDYGYFLMEEGKRAEAAEIFSKLLKDEPGNEEYLELLERLTDEQS
ncbi:tetratricopeptide repeat protein [Mesobacillus harenae]|uniref:tetratricopeptide repeat protein n=1 Tax=Mesobacillus harenae TaxID=2213203 RepID=UPI00157FCEE9|nr:tetratricopeptide repeat protein [Mesobacillus harenae]